MSQVETKQSAAPAPTAPAAVISPSVEEVDESFLSSTISRVTSLRRLALLRMRSSPNHRGRNRRQSAKFIEEGGNADEDHQNHTSRKESRKVEEARYLVEEVSGLQETQNRRTRHSPRAIPHERTIPVHGLRRDPAQEFKRQALLNALAGIDGSGSEMFRPAAGAERVLRADP